MTSDDGGLPPELDPRGPGRSRRARSAAKHLRREDAPPRPVAPSAAGRSARPGAPSTSSVAVRSVLPSPSRPSPSPPPSRRGSRGRTAAGWLATVLSVLVLLSSGVGYAFFDHYSGRISRIDVGEALGGGGVGSRAFASSGPLTFLLVGSDSRVGALNEEFQGEGDEETDGQRSDTIILVRVGAGGDTATAVSFPRDSYVTIPAHRQDGERVPERMDKINSALDDGGPALLVETVEELSGLDVDHYVQVDFAGFLTIVDALGGVEVCLTEPAREPLSGIDLPAGRQTISGAQALAFVRQRHGLPEGDVSRIQRQQQFLASVVRKVSSGSTLTNPNRLNRFLNAVTDSVSVDEAVDFRSLALRLSGIDPSAVRFLTVPISDLDYRPGGGVGSTVRLDEEAVEALFEGIDDPPDEPEPAPEVAVPPAEVEVAVLNGAGVPGLAGRVSGELEDVGFTVAADPADAEEMVDSTEIRHAPDDEDAATTLALALPGATLVEDDALEGEPLQVVLGDGDQVVEAVPGATPSDEATPAEEPAAAEPLTADDDVCGL